MPIEESVVAEAVQRYRREFDCYLKLARYVAEKCEREIVRANTLRASVTHRAKAPEKVHEKLMRKLKDLTDVNTAGEALACIGDLAGVRISTYQEQDRAKVVEEVTKLFDGPAQNVPVAVEKKDQEGRFYRATHCQVSLKFEDLEEPYGNLAGLTCEVQVCSMLAHVWNEIEHDLQYKPTTGEISDREKESLQILGNLTLSGDVVIKQLFDSNTERLAQHADVVAVFQDVYDFVARIRGEFPEATDFGTNAGQLYEDLVALGIDSPAAVRRELLGEGCATRAVHLLDELRGYLDSQHEATVELDKTSSDLLLMLLLEKRLQQVLDLHPMGRGRGRPPRIASIAVRFQGMTAGRA